MRTREIIQKCGGDLPVIVACFIALTLVSCSSAVNVTARRFSGIVIDTTMVVGVGTIRGTEAETFRNDLIALIKSSNAFTLDAGPVQGVERSAVLLVEGTYWPSSSEEREEVVNGDQKELHKVTTYTARFDYTITDMMTQKRVIGGALEEHSVESEKVEDRGFFEALFSDLFVGLWRAIFGIDPQKELRQKVAQRFILEISPREVLVEVHLFKDSDIPELEQGINYARAQQWKDALGVFLDVIDRYPSQRNIHKAYYDAGVAYEYDHQYSLAKEFLQKALGMSHDEEYRNELWRCQRYEQEYRWREGYLEDLRIRRQNQREPE